MAAALSYSLALSRNQIFDSSSSSFSFSSSSSSSGSSLKQIDQTIGSLAPTKLSFGQRHARTVSKRELIVQASNSDGGRSNNGSLFMGGFVLGGLVLGALGCVYAPQISRVIAGTDKKDLMRKLPKFIYDEEKALEKQRQKLTQKIEQLNLAIDEVSNQLQSEKDPNAGGGAVYSDEAEEAFM